MNSNGGHFIKSQKNTSELNNDLNTLSVIETIRKLYIFFFFSNFTDTCSSVWVPLHLSVPTERNTCVFKWTFVNWKEEVKLQFGQGLVVSARVCRRRSSKVMAVFSMIEDVDLSGSEKKKYGFRWSRSSLCRKMCTNVVFVCKCCFFIILW